MKVVATTTQLGDFVRAVGGGASHVVQLLQPNSDPHEYEPRPDDVRALLDAPLVFESGDGLDALDRARWSTTRVGIRASSTLADANVAPWPASAAAEASSYDPHWWHDPRNVEAAVAVIRDALSRANPPAARVYARNARAYVAQAAAARRGHRAPACGRVPAARRKLVTDHDAFGYFAAPLRDRGGRRGDPVADDAGAAVGRRRRAARATRSAASASAPSSPRVGEREARARGRARDGRRGRLQLYGDTLGPAGSDGATYLAMERHNADAMVRGFTGGARGCAMRGL